MRTEKLLTVCLGLAASSLSARTRLGVAAESEQAAALALQPDAQQRDIFGRSGVS